MMTDGLTTQAFSGSKRLYWYLDRIRKRTSKQRHLSFPLLEPLAIRPMTIVCGVREHRLIERLSMAARTNHDTSSICKRQ